MMKLLLATTNKGKVKDLAQMLKSYDIKVLSLADFPDLPEVIEDGDTFLKNATKKAKECFEATGIPTLADDSGLEVLALDNAPGVYSARYAGEPSNDQKNVAKMLDELAEYPNKNERKARFRCVLVFIGLDNISYTTYGDCEGYIGSEAKGDNGFGYDPLFVHPAFEPQTMAEVTREQKNSVSHRGIAFAEMLPKLKDILKKHT